MRPRRRRVCLASVCLNRCLQAPASHILHSQGFVAGVEGHRVGWRGRVGGPAVWETENAMRSGLDSQKSVRGDLLMETNASCHSGGSARVDEKPVSSPLDRHNAQSRLP